MKLLLAIVQDPDAGRLQRALTESGFGVTRLSSTGGFLRRGNTTLLIGIEDDHLADVTAIVERVCRRRQEMLVPGASVVDPEGVFSTVPDTVEVGGATLFVLGVEQFIKL
jgi:uncharacterized protein YaaQ